MDSTAHLVAAAAADVVAEEGRIHSPHAFEGWAVGWAEVEEGQVDDSLAEVAYGEVDVGLPVEDSMESLGVVLEGDHEDELVAATVLEQGWAGRSKMVVQKILVKGDWDVAEHIAVMVAAMGSLEADWGQQSEPSSLEEEGVGEQMQPEQMVAAVHDFAFAFAFAMLVPVLAPVLECEIAVPLDQKQESGSRAELESLTDSKPALIPSRLPTHSALVALKATPILP